MEIESILSKIGLGQGAIKVYLSCLQLGAATITEIAKAAQTKRPTTYLIVEDLIIRGYLSIQKKGLKKYYYPEPPSRLLQQLRFRVREMETLLPEIEALYNEPKQKPKIRIYEGNQAMLDIYEELYGYLGKKEEALFFTAISDMQKFFPVGLEQFVKRVSQRKDYRIRELNKGDSEGVAYAKRMKRVRGKNHLLRLLDPSFVFYKTDTIIFGNKVVIFSFKNDIFVIVIENKDIADTYRAMFNAAWQSGGEL